jgi:hypothetical protein
MIGNAPPRLASLVLDLKKLGAVRFDSDMRQLIRYHDSTRLYPARALVDDLATLRRAGLRGIPEYLTLDQAGHLLAKSLGRGGAKLLLRLSENYGNQQVQPVIRANRGRAAWNALPEVGQRAMCALAALSTRGGDEIVPASVADRFEAAAVSSRSGQFIWNPRVGLGYVGPSGYRGNGTAWVWFWSRGRKARHAFNLQYFKSVVPRDPDVLADLERRAFSVETDRGTAAGRPPRVSVRTS